MIFQLFRLVNLYGSILEKSVSVATKSSINSNGARASIERDSSRDMRDARAIEAEELFVVEEKYHVNHREDFQYYTEEFIDLANQHVGFKRSVTVVNFSADATEKTGQVAATTPVEKKIKRLQSPALANTNTLPANYVQQIREGNIKFQRRLKRTIGLCFFCDEQKSFTKLQWKMHLLTHTGENYYFCGECRISFPKRSSHSNTTCSPDSITNIYEKNNCTKDNGLAAFMCRFCDYVRVSELELLVHLRNEHSVSNKKNLKHWYQQCKFVTNVRWSFNKNLIIWEFAFYWITRLIIRKNEIRVPKSPFETKQKSYW